MTETTSEKRILGLLKYAGPGGVRGSEIAMICGLGSGRLYIALVQLEKKGLVLSAFGKGAEPRPRYYCLAEHGPPPG